MEPDLESARAADLAGAFARGCGRLRLDAFIDLALYAPGWGYYRRARRRVGRAPGTDFTTASAVGPEFGVLVAALAAARLRDAGIDPAAATFVEFGAEPGAAVLDGIPHPFAATRVAPLGSELAVPEARAACFANELLDAQPFRRFRLGGAGWDEAHVVPAADGVEGLALAFEPVPSDALPAAFSRIDLDALEPGWVVDFPEAALGLLRRLAAGRWAGAMLMVDYGRDWREIVLESPRGTGRTYRDHRVGDDLLELPGETDLTCHVPWDLLGEVLGEAGFADVAVERQEAAFLLRCPEAAQALLLPRAGEAPQARLRRVQAVKTLLHPAHYGAKFQVLSAVRRDP